jgi:hypothetical protein
MMTEAVRVINFWASHNNCILGYRGGNWNDRPRYGGGGPRFNNNRFSDYNRNRGSDDFGARRSMVNYRDLDAPTDIV